MYEYELYDNSTDYEDYHYQEDDYDYTHNSHRTGNSKDDIGCLQMLFGITVVICALVSLSFIIKAVAEPLHNFIQMTMNTL